MCASRPGRGESSTSRRFSCDLARRTLKICAIEGTACQFFELVSSILEKASDPDLRRRPHDFSRNGTLSPDLLVTLLLFMVGDANRRGYRHLLDAFWDECASHGLSLPTQKPVSAPAFCQARSKISTAMLRHVLQQASSQFTEAFDKLSRWRGRRVFAVDGSKFHLGRSEELDRHFGRPTTGHFPQATVSALVNVASGVPCDVLIAPYGSCERKLLLQHLDTLQPKDVLVLDRGYPSHNLFRVMLARKLDFLVRVPESSSFNAIKTFRQSGGDDYRVLIATRKGARRAESIELRAVKLTGPNGQVSFYLTSLRRSKYSRAQIAELYNKRWEAEELYRLQKADYFDQRQFHARTAHGVEQEILAQEIFIVIARFLLATAAERVDAKYPDLSTKSAVLGLATYITRICLDDPQSAAAWLPRLLARIARTRDKRRPGRSFPRRSFKPWPRWGPRGHRGA